ncbi:adenylate/guanylate cyclase domain-containing protein [Ramlibacter tataouinensis]|uniref:adenylate/guanylate cyclase domain-containing protein n=1 Tax=Ramlibacter tataouinensis TaxID=94132 RepID=UPI0007778534|nr:adenylate/guanylate cyclase domain-containing protein [Ramlibacter tataouinensis]
MECQACHKANPDSNRFCEHCGASFAQKCPACGFDCGPAARFCGGCGKPLLRAYGESQEAATAPPVAAAPPAGWGELKQATVLFADIVSSTEQIAQLDPEQAMDRLKPAVTLMCEAVERFGGTIMRTLGDGVMALFGVPKSLEGHATLACEAALHMQQAFTSNPQGLSIRVGLHSGLVASDPYAPDTGKGGGAHGLTIHLASRVVGVAPPGGVTITQDCYSLVRASVDVESIGTPPLKGISHPVEIFRLGALKPAFASASFRQGKLTPFRGRDKEMALLQQAQRLTEMGEAQVVGVAGGPGAGKSRLCYEFAQWCRSRGKPVFEVRAQVYGSAMPLQPVLELTRVYFFGIAPTDTPAQARAKIVQRTAQLPDRADFDDALLFEFLGVTEEGAAPIGLPPKTRRARLLAIMTALVKLSAPSVAVILVEDMHWLDEASEEFVAALIEAITSTRTLVVLNYRTSYRSPWAARDNFREIEVTELSAADTDAIVRELISYRREFQDIAQLVAKRSGGNPFFAEELVRAIAERGVLSGDPGHFGNGIDSVERALPATVQAVIGARIDRLGEVEKAVLQMCSIIGKDVPLAILEDVAGQARPALDHAIEGLCMAELIQPQPAVGGRRYVFRHPLIQEVAYGTQMRAKRATIHAAVAQSMERYYAEQIEEFAALISHHFEAAGQAQPAARYAARAARWLGATDPARAIAHWHKVRSLASQADGGESEQLRAKACSQICLLGWREGLSLEQVQPFIDEAMDLAARLDDRLTQLLLTIEGRMLQASGGPSDWYVQRVNEALRLADPQDHGRLATLNAALAQAYGWAGLLDRALAASEAALSGVHLIDHADHEFIGFSVAQWVWGMRGRALLRSGRAQEAQECWDRMLSVKSGVADPTVHMIRHLANVEFAFCEDDAQRAQQHADALARLAQQHAVAYLKPVVLYCRGVALTMTGDWEGAVEAFEQALQLVRQDNVAAENETEILVSLAETHRRAGRPDLAHVTAREALGIAEQRTMRLAQCRALITLGSALLDAGHEAHVAARLLEDAQALLKETGARAYGRHLEAALARLDRNARPDAVSSPAK